MDPYQGIDLNDRPGVPMEWDGPRLALDFTIDEKQEPSKEILHEPARDLTPVFGTGSAPRALSGVLRRVAYKIPDYRVKRWLILLVADRVDALEYRLRSLLPKRMTGGAR